MNHPKKTPHLLFSMESDSIHFSSWNKKKHKGVHDEIYCFDKLQRWTQIIQRKVGQYLVFFKKKVESYTNEWKSYFVDLFKKKCITIHAILIPIHLSQYTRPKTSLKKKDDDFYVQQQKNTLIIKINSRFHSLTLPTHLNYCVT